MNHKRTLRLLVGAAVFAALSLIFVIQGISERFDTVQTTYSLSDELVIEEGIPADAAAMVIRHFGAMAKGDAEAFRATLFREDGADVNSEPAALETFHYYKNTDIYIKEIRISDDCSPAEGFGEQAQSAVLDIVIWSPKDQQNVSFRVGISRESGVWGVGRYYDH